MKIYRNPDALWREEETPKEEVFAGLAKGEDVSDLATSVILLNGTMHAFNVLGTEIWKLCDGKTLEEIVSELEQRFDVELSVLKKDVFSFVAHLNELGLIYEK